MRGTAPPWPLNFLGLRTSQPKCVEKVCRPCCVCFLLILVLGALWGFYGVFSTSNFRNLLQILVDFLTELDTEAGEEAPNSLEQLKKSTRWAVSICNLEPQIWLATITSRVAKCACFKGSRTLCDVINLGVLGPFFVRKTSHHAMDASCWAGDAPLLKFQISVPCHGRMCPDLLRWQKLCHLPAGHCNIFCSPAAWELHEANLDCAKIEAEAECVDIHSARNHTVLKYFNRT